MGKIHDLAKAGNTAKLAEILPVSAVGAASAINEADKNGRTSLHIAAIEGKYDMIKYLLEIGAEVNMTDQDGKTPAQLAMHHDHDEALLLLLQTARPVSFIEQCTES